MSASREKKNRQDLSGSDWSNPKTAREAQQRKEEKRTNILYGTIGVVFLIVAIIAVIWKSNIIPKTATAATINGEKYTAAEVNYYFQNYYTNWVNQNYYYLSYIGLDTTADLRDQAYSDDQSWFDFFMEQTLDYMTSVQALNDAAAEEGFTWDDEMQADYDSSLEALKSTASSYGYTEKQYLGTIYGSTMTEKVYQEQLKRSLLAQYYSQDHQDNLTYTEDELTAAYNEDPNAYDQVSYQYVRISGAAATTDEDGNEIEVTDEMTAQAMADAKATADQLYADWQAGGDLEQLADDAGLSVTSAEAGTYSDSVVMNWLFDSARQAGDTAVLEDTDGSAYYVVGFNERLHDYHPINVRHILIQPEDSELSSDDEGYEADVEAKDAEAKQKAEDLLAQWKAGEATEDSFAELAKENSTDSNAAQGGLYEDVTLGTMVSEFEDWCFDPARQSGDTGIVKTTYGYHIMYFVGTAPETYWELQVTNALKSDDMATWSEEKVEGYTAEQSSFGMRFVG
ncbi:peptidylprolyl isomerase [Dysosmobacter sp.]|uniref:peptidylprolyl isomerase n=1 Tax=Dysosmobacter sp. TaxID=2591382 RepID=UPI003FD761F6